MKGFYHDGILYGSDDEPITNKLDFEELNMLATYNSEVARGIVHTDQWKKRMVELQELFNMDHNPEIWKPTK